MRKSILMLVVVFVVGLASSAYAAEGRHYAAEGMYVKVFGGLGILDDSTVSVSGVPAFDIETNPGFDVGGAVGFGMGMARFEGEVAYRYNSIDAFSPAPSPGPADGDYSSISFMANAYLDIIPSGNISPYIGGGIGAAQISFENASTPGFLFFDQDDTVFAGQIMAGVGVSVAPKMTIDAEYRVFTTLDWDFGPGEAEYLHHGFNIGVRVGF